MAESKMPKVMRLDEGTIKQPILVTVFGKPGILPKKGERAIFSANGYCVMLGWKNDSEAMVCVRIAIIDPSTDILYMDGYFRYGVTHQRGIDALIAAQSGDEAVKIELEHQPVSLKPTEINTAKYYIVVFPREPIED
ncbi:MAG: hypothetical protein MUD10_04735 [Candidatus Pacebacteria bacterium]|jgi:hypothetical protein|nr:hypothetical protein [Candidatus Paceibacterota bacterium]